MVYFFVNKFLSNLYRIFLQITGNNLLLIEVTIVLDKNYTSPRMIYNNIKFCVVIHHGKPVINSFLLHAIPRTDNIYIIVT